MQGKEKHNNMYEIFNLSNLTKTHEWTSTSQEYESKV